MIQVDHRRLGASPVTVPALGIGIWSWGDRRFWGYGHSYTQADIVQAFETCMDDGLNFFDTAEMYGQGESERLLGQCIREYGRGRRVIIATKFAPMPTRFSARTLLDALDASLERLGVQTIDLYQIHWPYTFLSIDALMDMLAIAVRSGKVRAVGVSNYNVKQMQRAAARLARHDIPLASNQVHYSLLHRKPEQNGVLAACKQMNVALIAYSPLEQGLLTGKFRVNNPNAMPITGARRFQATFRTSNRKKMEPLLQTMQDIAGERGKTMSQVALNWLLCKGDFVIPIPGAKNGRQASENAGALGWQLTSEEMQKLDRMSLF
ncbi:MAG TPA: aldo/keto reductase [Ktedonobacteraceae bacterium]|nr:aldo/keto reductase [Ktedonobacteraceae bacterium]